ncbi:hypothetical protein SCHPADRAFT_756053 [Schizopora paradoxa]|uniref:Uncharacterized protein n=1 Tax=Schizopora paradoxa TaxID=27342 RepID=A0A0H2QZF1_9AGAM|nr:hypothetical protein SCHPADRAFT_756053 [Schizopora paradoxa]
MLMLAQTFASVSSSTSILTSRHKRASPTRRKANETVQRALEEQFNVLQKEGFALPCSQHGPHSAYVSVQHPVHSACEELTPQHLVTSSMSTTLAYYPLPVLRGSLTAVRHASESAAASRWRGVRFCLSS